MGRGRALLKCHIAVAGQYREYPYGKVSNWISNLGGSASMSVNSNTTHVVATEKAWKRKDAAVANALKLIEQGEADIKIVSFDWLEDSVNNKTRKREGPYLWTKLDSTVAKQDAARAREEKAKKAKGHAGMMAEVLQASTEQYVDPRQAKALQKQIEREKRAKEQEEAEEREAKKEEEPKKKAEAFGRGAKKARNDLFTENHHIYKDDTGFPYDVMLTKVDTRRNRNERWAITIYESNLEPHTYACNLQFAATNNRPANNVITAIGSPFAPAYHQFKKMFKEKTGVGWDDRIEAAIERTKREKRERGQATGSEDHGSRKGVAVSTQEEKDELDRKAEEEFAKMPFEYHPPRFGSRGKLPKEKEIPADLVPARHTEIEHWMSGANGARPETAIDLTEQEAEAEGGEAAEGDANGFDAFINGDSVNGEPATENGVPNVLDKDLHEWLDTHIDEHYPFDHTAENLEYLAQTDGQFPYTDTFDTAMTNFSEPQDENGTLAQHDISFDHFSTDVTEPPISFNLPSTIDESFEPGTQDIADTQMADRARNELLEFADLPIFTESTNDPPTGVNGADTPMTTAGIDLGSSILGKRKTPPTESAQEALKSPRYDDEDEAFALAAEESFDAEQEYQFTSDPAGMGGDENMPRTMLEEYGFGSIDQAGEMDESVDTGAEGWVVVSDPELPGRPRCGRWFALA